MSVVFVGIQRLCESTNTCSWWLL